MRLPLDDPYEQRVIHHVDRVEEEGVVVERLRELPLGALLEQQRVPRVEPEEVLVEDRIRAILAHAVPLRTFQIVHARDVMAKEEVLLHEQVLAAHALLVRRAVLDVEASEYLDEYGGEHRGRVAHKVEVLPRVAVEGPELGAPDLLDEVAVVESLLELGARLAAAPGIPRLRLPERVDEARIAALAEALPERGEGGGEEHSHAHRLHVGEVERHLALELHLSLDSNLELCERLRAAHDLCEPLLRALVERDPAGGALHLGDRLRCDESKRGH